VIEDKLTHDERVRLECVAQSIGLMQGGLIEPTCAAVVLTATRLEQFVRDGAQGGPPR
jgi:hypothetical protein